MANTIKQIAALDWDWNGYGAAPYSDELIQWARDFIAKLPVEPEIYPAANIGIQLEYHTSHGYMELVLREEAYPFKSIHLFTDRPCISIDVSEYDAIKYAREFLYPIT